MTQKRVACCPVVVGGKINNDICLTMIGQAKNRVITLLRDAGTSAAFDFHAFRASKPLEMFCQRSRLRLSRHAQHISILAGC